MVFLCYLMLVSDVFSVVGPAALDSVASTVTDFDGRLVGYGCSSFLYHLFQLNHSILHGNVRLLSVCGGHFFLHSLLVQDWRQRFYLVGRSLIYLSAIRSDPSADGKHHTFSSLLYRQRWSMFALQHFTMLWVTRIPGGVQPLAHGCIEHPPSSFDLASPAVLQPLPLLIPESTIAPF